MTTKSVDSFAPLAKIGLTRRIALRALPLAVAAALTFGAAASPDVASAAPVGGTGAGCTYNGVEYSEGAIVKFDNGYYYICTNGKWEFHGSVPRPVTSQPLTVDPGHTITADPGQNITVDPGNVVLGDTVWTPIEAAQP